MSFVASPPAPASPAASVVEADGFWPDVDVNAVREALKLGDTSLSHPRLVAAIEGAMLTLMVECASWQALQVAAGAASIDDITSPILAGRSAILIAYERAVRYGAAAELADGHADLTATDDDLLRGETRRTTADDYRRMAITAHRTLMRFGVQPEGNPPFAGGALVELV